MFDILTSVPFSYYDIYIYQVLIPKKIQEVIPYINTWGLEISVGGMPLQLQISKAVLSKLMRIIVIKDLIWLALSTCASDFLQKCVGGIQSESSAAGDLRLLRLVILEGELICVLCCDVCSSVVGCRFIGIPSQSGSLKFDELYLSSLNPLFLTHHCDANYRI